MQEISLRTKHVHIHLHCSLSSPSCARQTFGHQVFLANPARHIWSTTYPPLVRVSDTAPRSFARGSSPLPWAPGASATYTRRCPRTSEWTPGQRPGPAVAEYRKSPPAWVADIQPLEEGNTHMRHAEPDRAKASSKLSPSIHPHARTPGALAQSEQPRCILDLQPSLLSEPQNRERADHVM